MVLATWVSMAAGAALDMTDLAAEKKEDIGWRCSRSYWVSMFILILRRRTFHELRGSGRESVQEVGFLVKITIRSPI